MRWSPALIRGGCSAARDLACRYGFGEGSGVLRNLEELRRLQSDRYLQAHLGILLPGIASLKVVLPGLKLPKQQPETTNQPAKPEPADINRSAAILHSQLQDEERRQLEEFGKKQPEQAKPRAADAPKPLAHKPSPPCNAPCPCGSGHKYKLCCGHWSKFGHPKAAWAQARLAAARQSSHTKIAAPLPTCSSRPRPRCVARPVNYTDTIITSSTLGPCTPFTRVISISAVAEGPAMVVTGLVRRPPSARSPSGTVSTS